MQIRAYLEGFAGEAIHYCANPGNGGDSAIAASTFQLFRALDIRYRTVSWDEPVDLTGETVFYAGGGNLTPHYVHARSFIERHHRSVRRLVVLPHTVAGHEDLLGELGENVEILCRERRSYDHVLRHAPKVRAALMHDMAFYLDLAAVSEAKYARLWQLVIRSAFDQLRNGKTWTRSPLVRMAIRNARARTRLTALSWMDRSFNRGVLNSFREDIEQPAMEIPRGNLDVPAVFQFGTDSYEVAIAVTRSILSFLSRFQEINTNRLHICILGALLGKPVNLYANNYFKCRAVYEHSLMGRFPNIRWIDYSEGAVHRAENRTDATDVVGQS